MRLGWGRANYQLDIKCVVKAEEKRVVAGQGRKLGRVCNKPNYKKGRADKEQAVFHV